MPAQIAAMSGTGNQAIFLRNKANLGKIDFGETRGSIADTKKHTYILRNNACVHELLQ